MAMSPIPGVRGAWRAALRALLAWRAARGSSARCARPRPAEGVSSAVVAMAELQRIERATLRAVTDWAGLVIGFLSRLQLFHNRQYCVIYPHLSIYHAVLGTLQQIATRFSRVYSAKIDDDLRGGGWRGASRCGITPAEEAAAIKDEARQPCRLSVHGRAV